MAQRNGVLAGLVVLAFVAAPCTGATVPPYFLQLRLHADAGVPPYDAAHRFDSTTDTGMMQVQSIPEVRYDFSASGDGNASSTAAANASFGRLAGLASASASGNPNSLPAFADGDSAGGEAWADQLHVVSDTLPAGAQVKLRLTLALNDVLSASTAVGDRTTATASAWVNGLRIDDSASAPAASHVKTVDLCAAVGGTFFLKAALSFSAGARPGTASVDVNQGAIVTLETLTPGAGYTTASGATYAPAAVVPEPATFPIVVLALAGMVRRRRCR